MQKQKYNTKAFIKAIAVSVAVIFALTIIAFFIFDTTVFPNAIFVASALSIGISLTAVLGFHDWKPKSKTIQILYYLVVILVVNTLVYYLMSLMYGTLWLENDVANFVFIALSVPISIHYIEQIYLVFRKKEEIIK